MDEAQPVVAVDIGNSALHFGKFLTLRRGPQAKLPQPDDTLRLPVDADDWTVLESWAPDGAVWSVGSVNRPAEQRLAAWAKRRGRYRLLAYTDLPIDIDVQRPDKAGMDRLAAATAANVLRRPDRPAVVIDSGTALTIDWVSSSGAFCGGAILPGMRMAAASLASATDLLPRLEVHFDGQPPLACGPSTEAAIASGLHWGLVGAAKELIRQMSKAFGESPQVFVSGGDAVRIAPWLSRRSRHTPNLVLSGIAYATAGLAMID